MFNVGYVGKDNAWLKKACLDLRNISDIACKLEAVILVHDEYTANELLYFYLCGFRKISTFKIELHMSGMLPRLTRFHVHSAAG